MNFRQNNITTCFYIAGDWRAGIEAGPYKHPLYHPICPIIA
ncbi:hypothetical protein HMPREF9136_1168 [Prevotella dentalis DSM 3688]|uniref:Uncharacterized protein n=1 Tax=Prevotella dentalis (strain ATCC 49559 / DSM 3688 / JCM 13448 / NCTC 12043 / ES 2772) TaxID=908937 RepID=F9D2U0_PREDD|nr:hypothetical protein HMPREF9136_1168 [Prevotella dentalis DSM 3688]